MKPIAIRALAACGLFCLVCPASAFEAYNIVPMWIGHEDRQASNAVDLASRTDVRLSLYSLSLHPEGRPAQAKADRLVDSYRAYARALRGTDVKAGVLVQSILGHWPRNDKEIEPWTRTVDQDGRPVRFCPLDPGFGAYIDRVFTDLARERPAFIMTDDDIRAYSHGCECFCERHVALFNARRGTAYDADALRAAVDSGGPGDPDYDAFMAMQREMVEDGVIGRIRRAIDSVDPSIPAGVCIGGEEHFFAEALARKIAAKGQRPVMRCATGSYFERMTAARFPSSALRQLAFAEAFRGSGIDLLDEADTCPHNLWSKSGRAFFTHLVSAAFAGYAGAKTWYVNAEKPGGLAVARQYADELERGGRLLSELGTSVSGSSFCGLMAPCFTRPKNWHATRNHAEFFVDGTGCSDGTSFVDMTTAFGIPTGVSREFGSPDTVFALTSREEAERLDDVELERIMRGSVIVFRNAALALTERGRADLIGAAVRASADKYTSELERSTGIRMRATSSLSGPVRLTPENGAETISEFVFAVAGSDETVVSPASVFFVNRLGGRVVTAAYSPDSHYLLRFNEARKRWLVGCVDRLSGRNAPTVVGNDQDVFLMERKAADTRYVLAVNMNSEPIRRLSVRLGDGRSVWCLDSAGAWRPVEFVRRGVFAELDVPVGFYEAAVLKIGCPEKDPAADGVAETLTLPQGHAKIVAYDLVDQTDGHDELVHVREWLLGSNEHQPDVTTSILSVEDMLSGNGTVFVRCAPLPHARVDPSAADFGFSARKRSLDVYDTGYPYVRLPYEGGAVGRTKALQDWQRTVRPYVSGRDGLFLSNTWGDRNRDTRINEVFLLDEVKAAAELGVEVVQVDDGWQSGKSMNSAYADGKGVWNGYWAVSPDFWVPDPKRFPHGLSFVTKAAAEKGIRFGLWYGPDSSNDAANWERDADWLLKLHRECGVDYFKLDSMKTEGALSLARQKKLFDKVLGVSGGKIVIDMDVTAEKRPGYFGMMAAGPLFVENRYSDYKTYWPHLTLRALWSLSEVIDPVRLRMEVLNPLRNRDKYGDDPLAPAAYPPETLLAIVLPASPLGWFEVQNLDPSTVAAWKPIVATWKHERDAMAACNILPVGARPDGLSWTGFVFIPRERGRSGYGLFFRELAKEGRFDFDFRRYMPDAAKATILSPRGRADLSGVETDVRDFVWLRLD